MRRMPPARAAVVWTLGALLTWCFSGGELLGETSDLGAFVSKDVRMRRAVTLDDYHPWKPYTDASAWRKRARQVREQILVAAGLWPMPPAAPLNPVIHGRIERDAYTIEKVFFQSYPGFYVTGNLYRPREAASQKRPGVLCPHGHWSNGRFFENKEEPAKQEVDRGAEERLEGARYPLQARCAMLARMGCVVFHYDMVGVADSKQIPHGAGFRDIEAELRLQSAFGLQTYDSIRSLDFLTSLPDVDPGRIGVTGASGGGTQTFFLCAVDDRPAVAFPAVMVSTSMQGGCVCENATLLRVGTGNIEFAALTAPRPLGMTGADDWTREIETKGLPELRVLYSALGVPDNILATCFPRFGHNYNQVSREVMYAWLNRHLKLGLPEPVKEQPFVPVPPAELSVFDAEHPRPADAVDIASLRKSLTEISDRQIEDLRPADGPTLAEFRRVVGTALRAIINSEVPEPTAVRSNRLTGGKLERAGGPSASWTFLTLTREGSGEEVPAIWLAPSDWCGRVVVAVSDDAERARLGVPEGTRGLARAAIRSRTALLVPDVFFTGRLMPTGEATVPPVDKNERRHKDYCGYTYGYNRSTLANRVHDALTAVGFARSVEGTHTVHLVGLGEGGLWALLARALAGQAVSGIVAEIPAFDFGDVHDVNDPRFFPGGVKYGGWGAFAALIAPDELTLVGDRDLPSVLEAAYVAAGSKERLRLLRRRRVEGAVQRLLR